MTLLSFDRSFGQERVKNTQSFGGNGDIRSNENKQVLRLVYMPASTEKEEENMKI